MKIKSNDIVVGIALIVFAILIILFGKCEKVEAQESGVYEVANFLGGKVVSGDSTNLKPNEALDLVNLIPDMWNVLTNREGYSYWNDSLISDNEIQQIFIYEPYADTQRLVFACNGFIYINPDLDDPGAVDWDTLRFSVDADSLIFTFGQFFLDGLDRQFFTRYVADGDIIIDENDATYIVDLLNYAYSDWLWIVSSYGGTTDTFACEIVKKLAGTPHFNQYRKGLHISDSEGFPLVYNDTSMIFLAVVDTGTFTSSDTTRDSTFIYNFNQVHISGLFVHGRGDSTQFITGGVKPGDIFLYYLTNTGWAGENRLDRYETTVDITFAAIVEDTLTNPVSNKQILKLDRSMPFTPVNYWNDYEIKRETYPCILNDTALFVGDNTKSWWDSQYGDNYLTTFYAVGESSGYQANYQIYCNADTTFTAMKTKSLYAGEMLANDNYTIFSRIPVDVDTFWLDQYIEFPRFAKTLFYNNQLYAFGYDQTTGADIGGCCEQGQNERANQNRIWYSEISMPFYIRYNYNFDITSTSGITNTFELRNGLYISDESSIWRFSGSPRLFGSSGDGIINRVVSNNGIPDIDNYIKATEEYGYFVNRTGIYRFDGVRPEKISWDIDRIIEDNYNSRIVTVFQDRKLFVSFPDSNFTLVYYEDFDNFYPLDFGMTCAYAPPDTNIIYFGLKGYTGRIYYYPNGEYWDRNSSTDSSALSIRYLSGKQSYGGYWKNKQVEQGYFQMLSPDTATIYITSDFDAAPSDTVTADSSGRFVYNELFTDVVGEYVQVEIVDTVSNQIIIGGYRMLWKEVPPSKK